MFPEIGSVGRNEKKKLKRKITKSEDEGWHLSIIVVDIFRLTTRMTFKVNIYIFGLKKCMTYCKKCSVVPNILVGRTMLNKAKKEDGHSPTVLIHFTSL